MGHNRDITDTGNRARKTYGTLGSKKVKFEKEYLRKSIYLSFPGPLKSSSSICYVLFSSEEKYCGALSLFHKIPLKLKWLHQPLLHSLFQITCIISISFKL